MTVYGQILGSDVMEDTMLAFLKRWLPQYLAEVDGQRNMRRGFTAVPRSWQVVPRYDNTLDAQLPAIFVVCPGTADVPRRSGDGTYQVDYTVGVAGLVSAPNQLDVSRLAKRYGASVVACVMQHAGLEDPNVEGVTWEGENFDLIPVQQDRTMASFTEHFNVSYKGVLNAHAGPHEPIIQPDPQANPQPDPTLPQPDWPTIPDTAHIYATVIKEK